MINHDVIAVKYGKVYIFTKPSRAQIQEKAQIQEVKKWRFDVIVTS